MIRKLVSGNHAILLENLQQLEHFAIFMSKIVTPGDFVALTGALGSGKTAFTQLFCKAMGIGQKITSPTFTLVNEYPAGELTVLHGDMYRLEPHEVEASLEELEDAFARPRTITLMEWADKAPQLAYRWTWHLHFDFVPEKGESARIITVEATDIDRLTALMKAWHHER